MELSGSLVLYRLAGMACTLRRLESGGTVGDSLRRKVFTAARPDELDLIASSSSSSHVKLMLTPWSGRNSLGSFSLRVLA